ncbi:MAG: hypothetical protein HY735_23040 [Verrucomicrobia bacterium]|nr:hypothetical protein [Verrucomicrobiota bacterium]
MRSPAAILAPLFLLPLVAGSSLSQSILPGAKREFDPLGANLSAPKVRQAAGDAEDAMTRRQRISDFDLPPDFAKRTSHRDTIDAYAQKHHVVAGEAPAVARPPTPRRKGNDRFVRMLSGPTSEPILRYRLSQERRILPLRGFRAPILEATSAAIPVGLTGTSLNAAQLKAAEIITRRLAHDGLLATLAEVVRLLGPERFLADAQAGLEELVELGFPVDWLSYFTLDREGAAGEVELTWALARRLTEGRSLQDLKAELDGAHFQFRNSARGFRAATETGEHEIGWIRMQVEGGYEGGIIPGDSLDVTAQMVAAMPEADFLLSIREDLANNLHWLAQHCWPLKRTNQVTIVSEKFDISPWSQDNGKAGLIESADPSDAVHATLVPRYASQGEDASLFMPGDSYLADGLRSAGHAVVQSPLLFQGGNLLIVRDPAANRRILLMSEAEIYRNRALGLTFDQVLEAFRVEFGVDQCVVLPIVSHHLDFDVSVRVLDGRLIAFVNDPREAARMILDIGLAALEARGGLAPALVKAAHDHRRQGREALAIQMLAGALYGKSDSGSRHPLALAKVFAADRSDSAVGNFQCFLAALDMLTCLVLTEDNLPSDAPSRQYFLALKDLDSSRQTQAALLRKLGWEVVPIPSLPDMYRTINYLNGVHDRARYLMPAYGGFYSGLDQAAANAFKKALGAKVSVMPVFTAALQRNHGAVHCVASVYPRRGSDPPQ